MEAVRLEELRQDFADCRGDLRHSWTRLRLESGLGSPGQGAYWSQTQCTRCDTKRTTLISEHTGEVLKRKYEYPEGYQLDEKITIAELRMEWMRRQKVRTGKRGRLKSP